ncbi:helix-turn-helix transcriptional regulator [Aestuariibacter sp. AA17]|uniref:Helix-turn-helix transcriptional regulator n=1 Tax=Fluctibacter corallii TaxID=2984329 RepID=A0ABT3A754_9ALTE|nr:response regulator transcription factor [Aestuariibacter sp. AA17]MCV2884511.1 helix-turn-helix transcriptional regulator [Aestuariibacter sp. AA17]
MSKKTFHSIREYATDRGKPAPNNPLFGVVRNCHSQDTDTAVPLEGQTFSCDFYIISLKHIISGEIAYGRTRYDYQNGAMIFLAPGQEVRIHGVNVKADSRMIMFHKAYLLDHPLYEKIERYHFFNYAVNEALHLSEAEEAQLISIFDAIETESQGNHDHFTRDIILSQLDTLLRYSERYYRRQFMTRQDFRSALFDRFIQAFDTLLDLQSNHIARLPTVEDIALQLHVTPRYLSDALKIETGKTAKEWIHLQLLDKAKNMLLGSNDSVANIAYQLGFEYPQYFARLFKKKIGITPSEFRNVEKYHTEIHERAQ